MTLNVALVTKFGLDKKKILQEKEKMLVRSIFFVPHNFFTKALFVIVCKSDCLVKGQTDKLLGHFDHSRSFHCSSNERGQFLTIHDKVLAFFPGKALEKILEKGRKLRLPASSSQVVFFLFIISQFQIAFNLSTNCFEYR